MSKVLIKNATLVTMDDTFSVVEGDLLIDGETIVAVGEVPPKDAEGAKTIDANGNPVIPGFVQTHIHLCQTLMRHMADDLVLIDWLRKRIWPYEAALSEETISVASKVALAELVLGGTTAIVDMGTVKHTDQVFEAIEESGVYAIAGKCMMDFGEGVPDAMMEVADESIAESLRLLETWNGAADGRIKYGFAPRFAVSCTEGLLREVSDIASDEGVFIHTHGSETTFENEFTLTNYRCSNVQFLENVGMTGERTIMAHGVHVSDEDCQVLSRTKTVVAHCPSSNLKLASGIANMVRYDRENVRVSLGADGAPCNNNLDQFVEMRLAALLQKPVHGPTAMPAKRVLQLATIDGAKAMGFEDRFGSLEIGKRANLIVLNLNDDPGAGPGGDIYARIVYGCHRANVNHVFCDGKQLVDGGELVGTDIGQLMSRGRDALKSVLDVMD